MTSKRASALLALLLCAGCGRSFQNPSNAPLQVFPGSGVVAPREQLALTPSLGRPPYAFEWGPGSPASGSDAQLPSLDAPYVAGSGGGATDVVVVRDAQGSSVRVAITVTAALLLSPESVSLQPGDGVTFLAQGGKPPYLWSLQSRCEISCDGGPPDACVDPHGNYRAGTACPNSQDQVQVTDAVGVSRIATVSLAGGVTISPDEAQVAPGQPLQFTASGGVPPYHFRFANHGNVSGGSLTAYGTYLAGPGADVTDQVEVLDSLGATSLATLQVGDPTATLPQFVVFTTVSGDFNGDHITDVAAVATQGQPQIVLVPGGASNWGGLVSSALAEDTCQVSVADFDDDGIDDLLVDYLQRDGSGFSSCVAGQIFYGSPGGLFRPGVRFALADPGNTLIAGWPTALDLHASGLPAAVAMVWYDTAPNWATVLVFGLPAADAGFAQTEIGPFALPEIGRLWIGDVPNSAYVAVAAVDGGPARLLYTGFDNDNCSSGGLPLDDIAITGPVRRKPDGGLTLALDGVEQRTGSSCQIYGTDLHGGDLSNAGADDLLLFSLGGRADSELLRSPGLRDGGFLADQRFSLGQPVSAVVVRPSRAGSGLDEIDGIGSGAILRYRLDGGALAVTSSIPGSFSQLVAGDFNGDGLPDLASLDVAGQLRLFTGSSSGALARGDTFVYGYLPGIDDLLSRDLDGDGLPDLVVAGTGLRLFGTTPDGRPSTVQSLDPAATFTALASGPGLTGWAAESLTVGQQLVPFTLAAIDAGAATSFSALGLPQDRPSRGLFGLDGGGLLVTGHDVISLDDVWAALVVPGDGGLVEVGATWEQLGGNQLAPVDLGSAGYPELAMITNDSTDTPFRLEYYPATPGAATPWASSPAWTVDLSTYFGQGIFQDLNSGLASFAIHPGGARDHLAGWDSFQSPGECGEVLNVWVADLSSGSAPTSPSYAYSTGHVCMPTYEARVHADDYDRDGNTDLAVLSGYDDVLLVLWGEGDGGFTASEMHLAGVLGGITAGSFGDGGALVLGRIDSAKLMLVPVSDLGR